MLSSQRLWPRSWSCCVGFILVSFLQEWNLFQISLEAQGKPAHMPDLQWRQTRQMHPIRDYPFSNVHPHAYTVMPFPFSLPSPAASRVFGRSKLEDRSVACKFFHADVVVIHSCFAQHLVQTFHHGRRASNVVDGRRCVLQMSSEHLLIDQTSFAVPRSMRFLHFSHAGN